MLCHRTPLTAATQQLQLPTEAHTGSNWQIELERGAANVLRCCWALCAKRNSTKDCPFLALVIYPFRTFKYLLHWAHGAQELAYRPFGLFQLTPLKATNHAMPPKLSPQFQTCVAKGSLLHSISFKSAISI